MFTWSSDLLHNNLCFQVVVGVSTTTGVVATRMITLGRIDQGDSPITVVGVGQPEEVLVEEGEGSTGLPMQLDPTVGEQEGEGVRLTHPLVHQEVLVRGPLAMATGEVLPPPRRMMLLLQLSGALTGTLHQVLSVGVDLVY